MGNEKSGLVKKTGKVIVKFFGTVFKQSHKQLLGDWLAAVA